MSAYVSAKSPIPEVTRPGRSRRCSCEVSRDSSTKTRAAAMPMAPMGTLMKKIQLQSIFSVSRPPTSGPIASAIAETPAQMPIAVPRCRGGKVAVMIDSVAGFINAPPSPCTTRAPIRKPPFGASPQARDAPVKTARPSATIARANATRLLERAGVSDYHELVRRSAEEPDWFWPIVVEDLGLEFAEPWRHVVDTSRGPEWATWFIGGRVSIPHNCVHRWAA